MANDTKTCNLTETEIKQLMIWHGCNLGAILSNDAKDDCMERLNYLNKRLKAFNETEKPETETKPTPAVAGWGTPTT